MPIANKRAAHIALTLLEAHVDEGTRRRSQLLGAYVRHLETRIERLEQPQDDAVSPPPTVDGARLARVWFADRSKFAGEPGRVLLATSDRDDWIPRIYDRFRLPSDTTDTRLVLRLDGPAVHPHPDAIPGDGPGSLSLVVFDADDHRPGDLILAGCYDPASDSDDLRRAMFPDAERAVSDRDSILILGFDDCEIVRPPAAPPPSTPSGPPADTLPRPEPVADHDAPPLPKEPPASPQQAPSPETDPDLFECELCSTKSVSTRLCDRCLDARERALSSGKIWHGPQVEAPGSFSIRIGPRLKRARVDVALPVADRIDSVGRFDRARSVRHWMSARMAIQSVSSVQLDRQECLDLLDVVGSALDPNTVDARLGHLAARAFRASAASIDAWHVVALAIRNASEAPFVENLLAKLEAMIEVEGAPASSGPLDVNKIESARRALFVALDTAS